MTSRPVTVVDYGIGNLLNVVRALERCGGTVSVIDKAAPGGSLPERLVLPGVGAFSNGMSELKSRGFDDLVKKYVDTGRPFLGICVGAQMLFDVGEEFGDCPGLGLIPGRIQPVPAVDAEGKPHRIPHIGWSALTRPPVLPSWEGSIFSGQEPGEPVYFVHSFHPVPQQEQHRLADTFYDGARICAAVRRDNVYGCQFHPERSGPWGLAVLENFLRL